MELPINDSDIRPDFVRIASKQYQKVWESLNDREKQLLESQASLRNLDTQEKADRFFETRTFDRFMVPAANRKLHESRLNESEDDYKYDPIVIAMNKLR